MPVPMWMSRSFLTTTSRWAGDTSASMEHADFLLTKKTRNAWDEHVTRYIYWGTIATDKLLGVLPFGLAWLRATSAIAQLEPTKGRDVNLRIYADYEALRAYQTQSVKAARDSLYT